MRVQVIVNSIAGQPAEVKDTVAAATYEDAVNLVFRNKAMYPKVERVAKNSWLVDVSNIANRIKRIRVRCRVEPKPQT